MRLRVIDTKSKRTGYITKDATFTKHAVITWHNGVPEELSSRRYVEYINGRFIYRRR